MDVKEVLNKYFGYSSFKEGQEDVIESILSGSDVLAIMPTGSGKSLCYQIPAMVLPGITIVISPLISLMQDQVKALNEVGISAGYINSSLSEAQIFKVYELAKNNEFKIIYVAPERLESYDFLDFVSQIDISMVTIDEAHCISQWGQDFRPSYLKIVDFIKSLSKRPIVSAFTATATEEVKNDIACVLNLYSPKIVTTGFDRENLYYTVERTKKKDEFVIDYILNHPNDSGIIYAATRNNVDSLYELLKGKGLSVGRYHAGMSNTDRIDNQNDFVFDRIPIIIATNAFGMGIDKSNVRFVIHYNMPQSMENYYQEAGRAGRDGETANCILLFSAQDIIINKFLLDHKDFSGIPLEDIESIKERDSRRLHIMEGYCNTTECLRNYILGYFGEKHDSCCNNCGNCHSEYSELDMTEEAKAIINCIYEAKGRYGINIILGTLIGANRARLKEVGAINYKTYGELKEYKEDVLKVLVNQMIYDGYIYQTDEKYSVLRIGNIEPLKKSDVHVIVKINNPLEDKTQSPKAKKTDQLTSAGYDLFEILRQFRLELARENAVPPYIVFNDKTLIDMCVKLPKSKEEMLNVSGVGETKFEKYGILFLTRINEYIRENPEAVTSIVESSSTNHVEKKEKTVKKKTKKREFYINEADIDEFEYNEYYYLTEIKDELNRISTADNIKKLSGARIMDYLVSRGYVEEQLIEGKSYKTQTALGKDKGIITVDKISKDGNSYTLLKYPIVIQKEIVKFFYEFGKILLDDEDDI